MQAQKEENIKRFKEQLEVKEYSTSNNEFETTECVICMESFQEMEMVMRIPICRHFFHKNCLNKWFESKADEDEQRCPQCNITLKTKAMEEKRRQNAMNATSKEMVNVRSKNHKPN